MAIQRNRLRIVVTQDDIDNGLPLSPHACPIARAITRKTGGHAYVSVYDVDIYDDGGYDGHWEPNQKVKEFIQRFDSSYSSRPEPMTTWLYRAD